MKNKNEKYFLNSLRYRSRATLHSRFATLHSGRITQYIWLARALAHLPKTN